MKPNNTQNTIFEFLFESNVCFAVCESIDFFKNIDIQVREFFIVIKNGDIKNHRKFGFKTSFEVRGVLIRPLDSNELIEFKDNLCKFKKVIDNLEGKVFELKTKSFKSRMKLMI